MAKFANRFGLNQAAARRVVILAIVCVAASLTNGCLWSANNDFPIYMNADDATVRFTWCGEVEGPFSYLSVEYRHPLSNRSDAELMKGQGFFLLRPGEIFASDMPPDGVHLSSGGEFDVQAPSLVFLNASESANDLSGLMAQFEVRQVSDVTGGNWLSSSGRVSDNPCGEVRSD